jgi:hypothetical protein
MGAITIKGVKTLVDCNEKLYLYYFEKSPIIIYNELFVHILGFAYLFMKFISYKFGIFHYVIKVLRYTPRTC